MARKGTRQRDNGEKYRRRTPWGRVISIAIALLMLVYASYDRSIASGKLAGVTATTLVNHGAQLGRLSIACEQMDERFVPRIEADLRFGELKTAQVETKKTVDAIYNYLLNN